jgi:6-phosphofructokinase 1
VPIPFEQILDPKTGKTRVRMLDTATESFASAMALQTRLSASDLEETKSADLIAGASKLSVAELKARFFG